MIYADFNGSAPLCSDVRNYLINRLENGPYANPNAIHSVGKKVLMGYEKCRLVCAKALGASSLQITFNSGASEGISQVFHSVLTEEKNKKVIILSGIEHSAVVSAAKHYEKNGFTLEVVDTLKNGRIDLNHFQSLMEKNCDNVALVSIMAANNETGVIQPTKEISEICQKYSTLYFSDTTQFIGKTPFNFKESNIDFAVMSGHKVGAMTGTGILLAKDQTLLKPIIFGGGQENHLRGGTQNYICVETLAVALENFSANTNKINELKNIREKFEANIKKEFPEVVIIGEDSPRLATTTLVSYPGIHGQAVQIELESQDIFVTTSSACSDNEPNTSKVLKSMGINDDIGRGVVRISLCCGALEEHYEQIEIALKNAYKKLKQIKSF